MLPQQAAEKVETNENECPQRLKPNLFTTTKVRSEARTLQKSDFFRKLDMGLEFTSQRYDGCSLDITDKVAGWWIAHSGNQ